MRIDIQATVRVFWEGEDSEPDPEPDAKPEPFELTPPAAKPRTKPTPLRFDDLLEMPWQGRPALEAFREAYPAYDGQAGRLSLNTQIQRCREWWEAAPAKKRWKTPAGICAWLARDYHLARIPWERDVAAGAAAGPPGPTPGRSATNRALDRQRAVEREEGWRGT